MNSFHNLFNSLFRNHAIIRRVVKQHNDTLTHSSDTFASTFVVPFNTEPRRTMLVHTTASSERESSANKLKQPARKRISA